MAEQFGRYRLDRLIGRGGMGEVWQAFDTVKERMVVLKRLPTELATDRDFTERFRRESALAARLREPHIIPIHDYGEIDGQLYIDMRLVDGDNLSTVLKNRGPLPPARAVDIVSQIAQALDAAHGAGLVHRDVTPKNIVITGEAGREFAYLIDFGISRQVKRPRDRTITVDGQLIGTIEYIAPERFDGVSDDRRIDVYALACVLFEALTNEKAFPGGNRERDRRNQPPPRPSTVQPDLPEALNGVVGRGLATEPQSRYDTAGQLAAAACQALTSASRPTEAPPDSKDESTPHRSMPSRPRTKVQSAPVPPPPRASRTGNRWKPVVGSAVTVVIIGAVIAGWAYLAGYDDPGIQVGDAPQAIALTTDGTEAYVVNTGSDTVSVIDIVTRTILATIPVGDSPQAIALSTDGTDAYVVNTGSDTVSVIDLATRTVASTVKVGDGPTDVAISRDGTRAYVSDGASATISVIDTARQGVTSTIEISDVPFDYLYGVAVSPDQSRVFVAMTTGFSRDDRVVVVDTALNRVVTQIKVGEAPRGVAISKDGRYAYVANSESESVSVIDVANNAETTAVQVGNSPQDVALSPNGRRAYVIDPSADTFAVIDTSSNLVATTPPAGDGATAMAISPDGLRALVVHTDSDTVSLINLM